MSNLTKLVDDLSALTVIEAAELSKMLEEKWGVSAAAPIAVAAAGGGAAAAAAPAAEKTEFDVVFRRLELVAHEFELRALRKVADREDRLEDLL